MCSRPGLARRPFGYLLPLSLLSLLASCGDPPLGQGIGLPAFVERKDAPAPDLHLVRAYAPIDGESVGFVELRNDTATPVQLSDSPVLVQSGSGSTELSDGVWQPGATLQVTGAAFDALALHPHAGELAIFDANLRLASYGAWGNDPSSWHSSLLGLAQAANVATASRPLPFPLATQQAVMLDAARPEATCADSNLNAQAPVATFNCATTGATPPVALARVTPAGVEMAGSAVEIINLAGLPLDIFGVRLCVGTTGCHPLMPELVGTSTLLPASTDPATGQADAGRRRIAMVDGSATTAADWLTSLSPLRSHDVVALAPPGLSLAPAYNVVALGTPQSPWPLPTSVVSAALRDAWLAEPRPAPRLAGESLALMTHQPESPNQPAAWRLTALPYGTALTDNTAPYDACSAPESPAARGLAFDAVTPWANDGSVLVTVTQLGSSTVQMAGMVLASGSQQVTLPPTTPALAAQEQLYVLAQPAPCSQSTGAGDVCVQLATPLGAGELTLLSGNAPVAHVAWDKTAATSVWGPAAALAGIWPGAACRVPDGPDFAFSRRLLRSSGAPGQAPPDFVAAHLLPHESL